MDDDHFFAPGLDDRGDDLPPDADELIAPGDIYGSVTGQRHAVAIRFIWKDGRTVSIPYGYLPLIWGKSPEEFVIEYPNLFSVLLRGKELADLQRRVEDRRIIWVREFDEHQAAGLASAVTGIEIIRSYPSREAGQ